MKSLAELLPLLPVVVLGLTAVALMISTAIRRSRGGAFALTLLGLAGAFASLVAIRSYVPASVSTLFRVDGYALFYVGLLLVTAAFVTLLSKRFLEDLGRASGPPLPAEEFYMLLVLATLGTAVLVTSGHFASLFLGLELLSISLYGMIAYNRRGPRAIEAGIKYLILAAVSSAFLLFGVALLYAEGGALALPIDARGTISTGQPLLLAGLALLLVGFGFKLAVVPFHLWTPDVYQGAPSPVAAFIATASKGAAMAVLFRFAPLFDEGALRTFLAVIAGASILGGNVLALRQRNLKRLLAYSSIAHLGYLLVAFLASGDAAARAVTFYLAAYTITTLGAFGVIGQAAGLRGWASTEGAAEEIEGYRGFGRRHPWLAGTLALMMLSLAGIPLTAGFVGKYLVLLAGIGSELWGLVALLALGSVVGVAYYLRVLATMYLRDAPMQGPARPQDLSGTIALAILALLLIGLGAFPEPLTRLVEWSCTGVF